MTHEAIVQASKPRRIEAPSRRGAARGAFETIDDAEARLTDARSIRALRASACRPTEAHAT